MITEQRINQLAREATDGFDVSGVLVEQIKTAIRTALTEAERDWRASVKTRGSAAKPSPESR